MLWRMKREIPARPPNVATPMGRIRWLRKSQWRFQNDKYSQLMSRRPEAGSQPRWTAKSKINSSANQKSGVAKPMKTKTVVALSKREYCRVADRTPMGTAKSRMIAISITLSRSEEHTSELQSLAYLVCRLLLEKKKRFGLLPRLFCRSA